MPHKFPKENNRNPGTSQLGHAPMSHVKLEGPKKHHDFHGKDDSVPGKGSKAVNRSEHWERTYDATDPSKNMDITQGANFSPKCAKDRKTTYIKVNEEDH